MTPTPKSAAVFRKYPVIKVRWLDHSSEGGWSWPKDRIPKRGLICESVGYRIERNNKLIVLAQSIEEQGKVNDTVTILTPTVISIRRLK